MEKDLMCNVFACALYIISLFLPIRIYIFIIYSFNHVINHCSAVKVAILWEEKKYNVCILCI